MPAWLTLGDCLRELEHRADLQGSPPPPSFSPPGRYDNSGIRLHYTAKLRRFNAGIMELGLVYTPLMAIPPKESAFVLTGYCTDKCTQAVSGAGPDTSPRSTWPPSSGPTGGDQGRAASWLWSPHPTAALRPSLPYGHPPFHGPPAPAIAWLPPGLHHTPASAFSRCILNYAFIL